MLTLCLFNPDGGADFCGVDDIEHTLTSKAPGPGRPILSVNVCMVIKMKYETCHCEIIEKSI